MNKRVAFYTLGCKVNSYDTEVMKEKFKNSGYDVVGYNELADIYIINTCSVTHLGDRKSRQFIRRAKRRNPESLIVATGCYAQVNPEEVSAIEEVDYVIGTKGRDNIVEQVESFNNEKSNAVEEYGITETFDNFNITENDGKTRAYVKVQDGCRQFCSYCIVPYARGPIRSRKISDTIEELKNLSESGYKEIVLTGIHIASFGKDSGEDLSDLIKEASNVSGIERIRLSSLEPTLITEEFLENLKKIDEFNPHFHLSLQSGSNSVLKRMNRHYTTEDYLNRVRMIRNVFPDAGITTDIIVGFPGETDQEFEETYNFAKEVGFSKIHIFPYSIRKGTKAAEMDQVADNLKKARVKKLTDLEHKLEQDFFKSQDNKIVNVLYEEPKNGYNIGHSENYIPVKVESDTDLSGQILKTRLKYTGENIMEGEII